MRCTHCNSTFRFSTWILQCGECKDQYCTKCMRRTNGIHYCEKCVVLIARPPDLNQLMKLKSKDLQDYLKRHNVSTSGVVEKRDLAELVCNKTIPVKNTKTSTVINKLYTNFESVFLPDKDEGSSQTSPTATQPPPRPPNIPSTSSGNLNSTFHFFFHSSGPEGEGGGAPHTLPRETRGGTTTSFPPPSSTTNLPRQQQHSTSSSGISGDVPSKENPRTTASQEDPGNNNGPRVVPPPRRRYPLLSDYGSAEDLSTLSAKELKTLLTFNRVDYKGCVEKRELLEKAERLWHDSHKQKSEDLPENVENLCKLCMDAPLDCVLLECGHIATCVNCGKKLAECPICRQYVSRVVRTFKA